MSESSPELSPFDQEFSDLSDDGYRNNDQSKSSQQTRLSVAPSPQPTPPIQQQKQKQKQKQKQRQQQQQEPDQRPQPLQAPLKIKLRLNPSSTTLVPPDDEKNRKKKHKKKKSHKKHRRSKHSAEVDGEDPVDVDDYNHFYDHKHRKELEQVNIDDDDDDSHNKNDHPQVHHPPVGGKRPFAMLHTETTKEEEEEGGEGEEEEKERDSSVDYEYYRNNSKRARRYTEEQEEDVVEDENNVEQNPRNNYRGVVVKQEEHYDDREDDEEEDIDAEVDAEDEEEIPNTNGRSVQQRERKSSDSYSSYNHKNHHSHHPADTTANSKASANSKSSRKGSAQQSNHSQSQSQSQGSTQTLMSKSETKKRGRPLKSKTVAPPPPPQLPQKGQEQPKKDLKTVCLKLLETLEKRDAYGFFLEPVDTRLITDYLTVIKRPMDFSTIRRKIETGRYRHLDEFRDDFLLIVTNAKTYNAPGTIYWKTADRLQHFGLKSIERAENTVNYDSLQSSVTGSTEKKPIKQEQNQQYHQHQYHQQQQQQQQQQDEAGSMTVKHKARKNSWSRKLSTISTTSIKKDPNVAANVKMEEDVDILGLDGGTVPLRKASRQGSESLTMREASVDFGNSRAMTPNREPKKKKKKKMNEAGVVYAPDGSLNAVGGVTDLNTLLPPERPFADPPQLMTVNPQALPSAFYQSRNALDDWTSNKHLVHTAHFCDYGPFTTLGMQTPGAFYTAQDASFIYPLYGDDRGEAYMKSIWDFADGLDIQGRMARKARYLTRGAWDVARQVLLSDKKGVETEFGYVDVPGIVEAIEDDRDSMTSQSPS
ncbi:hypothetical protein F4703DRAFT_1899529 [Phycomyces blakesleeanus]